MVSHQAAEELQQARADKRYATLLTDYEWESYQDILQRIESDQVVSESEAALFARVLAVRSSTSNLKGFTSHESLKDSGLTHMNARLYDPELGRFMTPDSMIPEPGKPLSYNRYSYVYNNPAYSDPTGHFALLGGGVVLAFVTSHAWSDNAALQAMTRVAVTAALTVAAGPSGPAAAAALAGGTSLVLDAAVTGHIQGPEIRSAIFAAVSAAAAVGVKGATSSMQWYSVAIAHGATQGTIGWLRNGDFKTGFVSGLISHASAAAMDGMGLGDVGGGSGIMGRTAVASVFGGMAAEATGGDFAQGAMTAAIVHLFNYEAKEERRLKAKLLTVREGIDHSALWLEDDGYGNGPVLYDPGGREYAPAGIDEMRYANVFTGENADPQKYVNNFNGDVDVIDFNISVSEARAISSQFFVATAPFCAISVSSALSNAKRFENVGGIYPGSLHNSLKGALEREGW